MLTHTSILTVNALKLHVNTTLTILEIMEYLLNNHKCKSYFFTNLRYLQKVSKYLKNIKDKVNCLTLLSRPSCCRDHSNHPWSFHSWTLPSWCRYQNIIEQTELGPVAPRPFIVRTWRRYTATHGSLDNPQNEDGWPNRLSNNIQLNFLWLLHTYLNFIWLS